MISNLQLHIPRKNKILNYRRARNNCGLAFCKLIFINIFLITKYNTIKKNRLTGQSTCLQGIKSTKIYEVVCDSRFNESVAPESGTCRRYWH